MAEVPKPIRQPVTDVPESNGDMRAALLRLLAEPDVKSALRDAILGSDAEHMQNVADLIEERLPKLLAKYVRLDVLRNPAAINSRL